MDAKTLILGCSRDARQIAEELLETNSDVIVAMPGHRDAAALFDDLKAGTKADKLEVLSAIGSVSCSGSVGRFELTFTGNGKSFNRTVSSIVVADDMPRKPNFALYGLSASKGIVSLSQFHEMINAGSDPTKDLPSIKRIAFVVGLAKESNPIITQEVMRCALKVQQESALQTYIFTGNLKVAENGLEILYRQTKKAGTVYMKFTETIPDFQVDDAGKVSMTYMDEIIRETFILHPDLIVIDESLEPSAFTRDLSKNLEIDSGPDGFVQSDNVHRATVLTNRKGIFVAGSSRCIQTERGRQADVGNVALAVKGLYQKPPEPMVGKAEIHFTGHCVGCLTCFRSCPYGAITLSPKVTINSQACEGCGICAAECPRFTIDINVPEGKSIAQRIPDKEKVTPKRDFVPMLTVFCCSRSAARAKELAACMGYQLPAGLRVVEVPCAGAISRQHLFLALSKGADGVLVLTCHKGNCHSERGNEYAQQRVVQLADMLPQIGFELERVAYKTLASNMGTEFAEMINTFENTIRELGQNRLNRNSER